MPTYDYVCDACGHAFELFQSIKDNPIRKCPKCAKQKLRRLFGTGAAIVFKGSGFYQTDYRSESYKKQASAEKSSDKSSENGADKKSEKSAEKSVETSADKSATDGAKSSSSDAKPASGDKSHDKSGSKNNRAKSKDS